ncbi:hypothetical protein JR316_0010551 [Psilocybe cubensis]|uniref:Mitochondrial splicing suppressor 51-like C-terminal domain-containing protein n=2 Tax=Psilocybe cubensis TaxID=181762 RepID=A0A8H7XK35_PSICU|nr:hypothetical protein JR316_0010551 [Psilocybe cubensis]KAH9476638.1 hypothetical protein JR316_0010551 [Psilocybe cubensis]
MRVGQLIHDINLFKGGFTMWTPSRRFPSWRSLRGLDWENFRPDVEREFGHLVPPYLMDAALRCVTEGLAAPMTILWALELFNEDDSWTKKETLTIHVCLGAGSNYYEYIARQGEKYVKPDLAVAFDAGCSEPENIESWRKTMAQLVKLKIPCVFTAFCPEDSIKEANMLIDAGAVLHKELTPTKRNPWGSQMATIEAMKVTGFYSKRAWLTGSFCQSFL